MDVMANTPVQAHTGGGRRGNLCVPPKRRRANDDAHTHTQHAHTQTKPDQRKHEKHIKGATGFVGSLVLELLLRTTDVARVFVLARGKRGASARERVARLLHGGLFRLVRDRKDLLDKVAVVEGDLALEDLGLSQSDQAALVQSATFVIHAASVIEVEADVQRTLRGNYLGTKRLLLLAARMPGLRAVVCVSAAAANVNLPPGSAVDEAIYPLRFGDQEVRAVHVCVQCVCARVCAGVWMGVQLCMLKGECACCRRPC